MKQPPSPGRAYQIISKRANCAISPKDWEEDEEIRIDQWTIMDPSQQWYYNQVWHLFPVGGDVNQPNYLIVNKRSGMAIAPDNFTTEPKRLWQFATRRDDNLQSQLWYLVADKDSEYYEIVNKRSGLVTTPSGRVGGTAPLDQWYRDTPPGDDQLWRFELVDEYKEITDLANFKPPDGIGDVIRLTEHQKPTEESTTEVLVGKVAVPFAVQNDGVAPRVHAQDSPYLILECYQCWKLQFFYEHPGSSEHTEKKTIMVGLTTTNSREVEKTTGIAVTSEAGFAFSGLSALIGGTIATSLRTTYASSRTESSTQTKEITQVYPANGKRYSEALWCLASRYVAKRMDGSTIIEWTTLNDATSVRDGWPEEDMPPPQITPVPSI